MRLNCSMLEDSAGAGGQWGQKFDRLRYAMAAEI